MKLVWKVPSIGSSFGSVRRHACIFLVLLLCIQGILSLSPEFRAPMHSQSSKNDEQHQFESDFKDRRPEPLAVTMARQKPNESTISGASHSLREVGRTTGMATGQKTTFLAGPTEPEVFSILRSIYYSLGGLTWRRSDGWLQPTVPICDWWGVTCLPRNYSKDFSPLVRLELYDNLLHGFIPSVIGGLSTLQVLDLSDNGIQGAIPDSIGNLTELVELRLGQNELVGLIPSTLCDTYATLEFLDLGGNHLSSPLPSTFYYLSGLQFLNLSSNAFHERLPEDLAQLTSLSTLLLQYNNFYGPLPRGLASLIWLKEFDISNNHFSGEISPDWTSSLVGLQVFIASYNNFTGGTLGLGYLINIRKLLIDHNHLTGELHPYLYQLSECIALDLSRNELMGYVPESLLNALVTQTQIIYLNLMGNPKLTSWEQRIPRFLGQDPHATTHGGIGSFVCHRLYRISSPSTTIMVDPSFFSYAHCNCIRDSYGHPPDQCYDCPPGAYCSGSPSFTFDRGWYPIIAPPNVNISLPTLKSDLMIEMSRDDEFNEVYKFSDFGSTLGRGGAHEWEHASGQPLMPKNLPKDYMQGPVLLYPCPDLSTNASACNPSGDSRFQLNSQTSYGLVSNETVCEKGYDLRLCSFCTCAAASNPACTGSSLRVPGSGIVAPGDCSCYYRSALKCVKCNRVWRFQYTVALAVSLWLLFILLMAFIFYIKKAPVEATPLRFKWVTKIWNMLPAEASHAGYLKILVVYLQSLSVVSKDPILRYFKLMTGDIFSFGAICAWPLLSDPLWQHTFYLLLPVGLLLGLFISLLLAGLVSRVATNLTKEKSVQEEDFVNDHLIYGGGTDSQFDSQPVSAPVEPEYSLVAKAISMTLTVSWWFLFGIAFRALSVFNCASDPLSSFLETQPWLGCHSPEWKSLKMVSIAGIVVYLGVVPFVYALLLLIFRNKIKQPFLSTALEVLCSSYRSSMFWYEMIATIRRIGLAAGLALLPGNSAFKMSTVCLILVVGLYAQIVFRPFVSKFENVAEELSMVTVLLTYASQYGFNVHFAQMASLNIVTIVVNFLMLAAIIYTYISRTFFPQYRFFPWSKAPSRDNQGADLASISPSVNHSTRRANRN